MSGKSAKLKLPTECIGKSAADLWPRVREVIEGSNPVYIDAEGVTSIDTTALQILVLLARELDTQDRALSWSSLPPKVINQIDTGAFRAALGVAGR